MRSFRMAAAAALVAGAVTVAYAQMMSAQDFASTAASSDMFEIRSSELALQKGQNAAVKEFAQMMINDHTKASAQLKERAAQAGVTVPADMLPKHAEKLAALDDLTGAAFDERYVDAQVEAHQEALTLMTTYAQGGDSEPLKQHAAATAPVIQMHLEHVQKMDQGM